MGLAYGAGKNRHTVDSRQRTHQQQAASTHTRSAHAFILLGCLYEGKQTAEGVWSRRRKAKYVHYLVVFDLLIRNSGQIDQFPLLCKPNKATKQDVYTQKKEVICNGEVE